MEGVKQAQMVDVVEALGLSSPTSQLYPRLHVFDYTG